ncbi:MAG TPA: hypothetical protein VFH27_18225 [Longimicrobiaceae bacterium]|nr:hypothetical protein [Longimicrobiaceae bacterium]
MHARTSLAVAAALLATTALGGTAHAQRGRGNLPQVTCGAAMPEATREAQAAEAALDRTLLPRLSDADKQRFYTTALQQATAGITAKPDNPYHHFLAGRAHAGMGHLSEATAAFDKALQLCPGFADEVKSARTEAIDAAFNGAIAKYAAGDTTAAIAGWETVAALDSTRAEAIFNLGVAYGQRGDLARSTAAYRRILALNVAPSDTAGADRRIASMGALLSAGANLFQQNKFAEAHDIFVSLRNADPNNRDAIYNDALSLYKTNRWTDEVPVATRLLTLDPLNYNAQIILFNAYKGLAEEATTARDTAKARINRNLALHTLEAADALPVQVSDIQLSGGPGSVTIKAVVTGAAAPAGVSRRMEFTVTNAQGPVGTGIATFTTPAKDAKTNIEVTIPTTGTVTSWRYRLLP